MVLQQKYNEFCKHSLYQPIYRKLIRSILANLIGAVPRVTPGINFHVKFLILRMLLKSNFTIYHIVTSLYIQNYYALQISKN